MNIAEVIEQRALEEPHAIAIIEGRRTVSYGSLDRAVLRAAQTLLRAGVAPGDVVGVTLPQRALHVVALLALARIGAVSVQLRASMAAGPRAAVAQRFRVRALVADSAQHALPGLSPILVDGSVFDASSAAPRRMPAAPGEDAVWRIALSSGTTAMPKGIPVSHRRILDTAWMYGGWPQTAPGARSLAYLDLNTTVSLHATLRQLVAGRTAVLVPGVDPPLFFEAVDRYAIDTCMLSPALLAGLSAAAEPGARRCPSVRMWVTGGLLAPAERARALDVISPHLVSRYGSSETGALAVATSDLERRAPGTVGRMLPWNRVQVIDENDAVLPPGERGRLRFRGPEVAQTYYDDPQASAESFRDGWFYPGDVGRVSADGLLFVEGRDDEILNVGGHKVNANDIDALLASQPGVAEAGSFVARMPDGSAVLLAAVVSAEPVDERVLVESCRARFGVGPARVLRVRALPRNAAGKLERVELSRRARVSVERRADLDE